MADVDALRGLLERVRASDATLGIDLNLEAELLHRLFGSEPAKWPSGFGRLSFNPTASVDDAIALATRVLPGWDLEFDINALGKLAKGWATLRGPNFTDADMSQWAQTDGLPKPPPIAILDALLQALIAQAEGGEHGQ